MRQHLVRALPAWKWRCGDDDTGSPQDESTLARPQTIMGQAAAGMVMMTIESRDAPLPPDSGAPPHRLHLHLSQPSTDDADMAKRLALVVCTTLTKQNADAHCQIVPGGEWCSAEEMAAELALCSASYAGDPHFASSHPEAEPVETMPQTFPRRASAGGFGRKGL